MLRNTGASLGPAVDVRLSARWRDAPARALDYDELVRRVETLEKANEALSQFAAIAAHDLRSPLGAVHGFAHMLLERDAGPLTPLQEDCVQRIVTATARMTDLIDDLLTLAQTSSAPRREQVDSGLLVDQALETLADAVAASGARVEIGPLPKIVADPTQLTEVFQNLIANAVKFVAPGVVPNVRIEAAEDMEHWTFAISDNGIGIDPGKRDEVFAMFTRLHSRSDYEGTGIGLAICKRIVETHGGRIGIDDAPGGGSRFSFTLAKP